MSKDGGSAFPVRDSWWDGNETKFIGQPGMTLRDYFAGLALAAGLYDVNDGEIQRRAKDCYAIADAMLKARERQ